MKDINISVNDTPLEKGDDVDVMQTLTRIVDVGLKKLTSRDDLNFALVVFGNTGDSDEQLKYSSSTDFPETLCALKIIVAALQKVVPEH